MTASATASRPASASKTKAKVTASAAASPETPAVTPQESTINRDTERLTYGDACKLISRLLVANANSDSTVDSIRDIIDGTGLPCQFVDTQAES